MSAALLRPADVRLIHLVAAHRRGVPAPALDEGRIESALGAVAAEADATAFRRAALAALAVLQLVDDPALSRQMGVLALCAQLSLDGFSLVAPQGVLAGMIVALQRQKDPGGLARWLEDRALPAG